MPWYALAAVGPVTGEDQLATVLSEFARTLGRITVDSHNPGGTTFTVTLPLPGAQPTI